MPPMLVCQLCTAYGWRRLRAAVLAANQNLHAAATYIRIAATAWSVHPCTTSARANQRLSCTNDGGGYARWRWPQTKACYEPSRRAAHRRYCMVHTIGSITALSAATAWSVHPYSRSRCGAVAGCTVHGLGCTTPMQTTT